MSALMADTNTDRIALQPATVIKLKEQQQTPYAYIASALSDADIREYASMKFLPDPNAPDRLLGVGLDVEVDGRSEPAARTIGQERGRIAFPITVLEEVLDITVDDIQAATDAGDPIRLLVYAGDEILAFERVDDVAVSRELVTETQRAGGDD